MKIVIRRDPVANKDRVPRDAARDSGGYWCEVAGAL